MIARPFLRIAGHEIGDWTTEWRGWFVECRTPSGAVVATHVDSGLHVTQPAAFRAALAHLKAGGCPVDAGDER